MDTGGRERESPDHHSQGHREQTADLQDVEIEGHEPKETNEFLRRVEVVYHRMFAEHSKCALSACPGHGLPPMATKFLAKLKYPTDAVHNKHARSTHAPTNLHTCTSACTQVDPLRTYMHLGTHGTYGTQTCTRTQVALYLAAKKWFAEMDVDLGGTLSKAEVSEEFEKMGIHRDEATQIMKFASSESSGGVLQKWTSKVQSASSCLSSSNEPAERQLSLDQFVKVIVYVLDNSIDHFSAADVCTLGALLHQYDTDGNGLMNFEEFSNIALDLVRTSFVCNRPQSLCAMHLHQLDALRLHRIFLSLFSLKRASFLFGYAEQPVFVCMLCAICAMCAFAT